MSVCYYEFSSQVPCPNDVPNIPGHVGQDGLLAEGYVAKMSMPILATDPVAAWEGTTRNQNQK